MFKRPYILVIITLSPLAVSGLFLYLSLSSVLRRELVSWEAEVRQIQMAQIVDELKVRIDAADIELHASHSYSWDVHGFGERWTWVSGTTWQHKTWQTGATVTSSTLSINPPEGP